MKIDHGLDRELADSTSGVPDYFIADDLRRGRMVRLLPRVKLPRDYFRLVWRRGHRKAAALERLAEGLREVPLR